MHDKTKIKQEERIELEPDQESDKESDQESD
jgi:hypothetical protein